MVQNLSKICSKCNTLKELNNFNFTSVKGKSPYLRANCKSCQSLIRKQHYRNNKQKTIEKCKIYYENHKKEKLLYSNKWKKQNIEYMKKYFRYYYKLKRKNDISFKLRENISRRIRGALFNGNKSKNTMELLGCQIKELKSHLEKQFKDGMTWDNYGDGT